MSRVPALISECTLVSWMSHSRNAIVAGNWTGCLGKSHPVNTSWRNEEENKIREKVRMEGNETTTVESGLKKVLTFLREVKKFPGLH